MAGQDFTCTSNIIHDYEFSWTIDNFSTSPDLMKGPSVPTYPGFPGNLFVELQYTKNFNGFCYEYKLIMNLIDLNVKDRNLSVSSQASFRDKNDKSFKEYSFARTEFKGSIRLLDYPIYTYSSCTSKAKLEFSQDLKLSEDKLVVKGKLSFSGYDIATIATSQIIKDENEVSRDFQTMYESGKMSDVTFSVGEKTLRAHKNILVSRSPVFAKMFGSDMLENNSSNIVIEDSDFDVFNCFLMFLYTGILEDKKWGTVLALYSLGHKYQVKSLHEMCSGILADSLTIDYVCSVLALSELYLDKELKEVSKIFIRHHLFQIAGTTEWVELVSTKPDLVKEVLS